MSLRVNFSDKEAASEARDLEPMPAGKYLVSITDVEVKESTSQKNYGKPYFAFEFTVQEDVHDGKYVGRKAWGNVMLFEGALYSLAQMMKAVWEVDNLEGDVEIPEGEEWMGKELVIQGTLANAMEKQADGTYATKWIDEAKKIAEKRFEVKGYRHPSTWKPGDVAKPAAGRTVKSPLLPS